MFFFKKKKYEKMSKEADLGRVHACEEYIKSTLLKIENMKDEKGEPLYNVRNKHLGKNDARFYIEFLAIAKVEKVKQAIKELFPDLQDKDIKVDATVVPPGYTIGVPLDPAYNSMLKQQQTLGNH